MSRSIPLSQSAITPILLFALTSACGHTDKTLDAFEQAKDGVNVSNNGGGTGTNPTGNNTGGVQDPALPAECSAAPTQQFDPTSMQSYVVPEEIATQVENTLAVMGPEQKYTQLMGVDGAERNWQDIQRSPDVDIPGFGVIRGYRYRDAGRGVNLDARQDNRPNDNKNFATAFPTPSLRAASWDVDLERRVGSAIGDETAASKNNINLGPCMNIVRHPYWGRTQETYGEDMYHIGRMATAYTVGVQEYVVGCAKHWAANNIEDRRSTQNAIMDQQTLREVYGRHFEMVVQDGAIGCVMAAYNLINGVKAVLDPLLLRDILKGPISEGGFGFGGFVLTDWWAMPGDQTAPTDPSAAQSIAIQAVDAGLDVEVPWTFYYNQTNLPAANQQYVTDAARRVLTQKYLFNSARDTDGWSKKAPVSTLTEGSITPNPEHEALAEEAAIKSAVLLTNGLDGTPVLPLTASKVAVVGPEQAFSLISSSVPKSCGFDEPTTVQGVETATRACTFFYATQPALGDRGSSRVNADPERSYGPFKGIEAVSGDRTVVTVDNVNGALGEISADTEAIVVAVGYTPADEGEEYAIASGGDRASLNLPPGQNDYIMSVLDLDKPTVIIVQGGSIVNVPWLSHGNQKQATIWAGYPGQAGGLALGKLIFGDANFSGKMPMAWPEEDELVTFRDQELATTMGYFFGYREFDRRQYVEGTPVDMVFPFGHGLSYTTFEYSGLAVPCEAANKDAIFNITVDITNSGTVDGDEVAMLFVKPPPKPEGFTGHRPWKELKSFARVSVPAGQTVTAELPLRIRDLRRWEGGVDGRWVVDSGEYQVLVGKNAADAETGAIAGTVMVNGD